jgi:hypothetical protein
MNQIPQTMNTIIMVVQMAQEVAEKGAVEVSSRFIVQQAAGQCLIETKYI